MPAEGFDGGEILQWYYWRNGFNKKTSKLWFYII